MYIGYCTFQKILRQSGAGASPRFGSAMRTRAQFGDIYVFIRLGGDRKLRHVNAKMRQSKFQSDCTRIKGSRIKILLKNIGNCFIFLFLRNSALCCSLLRCPVAFTAARSSSPVVQKSKCCKSVSGVVWNKCEQANPAPDFVDICKSDGVRKWNINLILVTYSLFNQCWVTKKHSNLCLNFIFFIQVKPKQRLTHGKNTQLYCETSYEKKRLDNSLPFTSVVYSHKDQLGE